MENERAARPRQLSEGSRRIKGVDKEEEQGSSSMLLRQTIAKDICKIQIRRKMNSCHHIEEAYKHQTHQRSQLKQIEKIRKMATH